MTSSMHPDIVALILAGGKSSRMGQPKAWIDYHGAPQVLYLQDMLKELCANVCISANEWPEHLPNYTIIPDHPSLTGHGPISGLLSAFLLLKKPILLIACDYPYLEKKHIHFLLSNRDKYAPITGYKNSEGRPEPLCTLYEYSALEQLQNELAQGNDSLYKWLLGQNSHWLKAESEKMFMGADTPEQAEAWKQALGRDIG